MIPEFKNFRYFNENSHIAGTMDSVNLPFTDPFSGDELSEDVTLNLQNGTRITSDGMVLDGMFKYADLGVHK